MGGSEGGVDEAGARAGAGSMAATWVEVWMGIGTTVAARASNH